MPLTLTINGPALVTITGDNLVVEVKEFGTQEISPSADNNGANAGGEDVTRSVSRAPVEAGIGNTSLAGGLEAGIVDSFVNENASGPDVKRAPNSKAKAGGDPLAPKTYVLRPHCMNPENCGGFGSNHCHSCITAGKLMGAI